MRTVPPPLSTRIVSLSLRYRWWWGGLAIVLVLLAWKPASQLKFEQSIESLYSADDPVVLAFRRSKEYFGGDEFAFIAWTDPELNLPQGLERVRGLAKRIATIPGIKTGSVQDLATTLAQARLPLLRIPEEQVRELVRGVLLGQDNETTAVVARFEPIDSAPVSRSETIRQLRQLADQFQRETSLHTHVVGEPIQVLEAFRYVEEDGLWLWVYSSGLLLLVMLILFRSVRWTILPLIVVGVTVVWTRALLVLAQFELSMVSSMLNSLVTIIGIATVVHVAVQFREQRNVGVPREAAFDHALSLLTMPIFWTVITTAIGFGVLISSEISPVRSFGLMMCIGTLVVLPAVFLIVPAGALAGSRDTEVRRAPAEDWLNSRLKQTARIVNSHPTMIGFFLLVVLVVSGLGCLRLRIETDFSKNFHEDTPIVRGLNFIETWLGGAGTFEVNFSAPEELTVEFLERVDQLAGKLRDLKINGQPALTKVISLADGEALVPRTLLTASLSRRLWLLDRIQPEYSSSLYQPEKQRMRIMLRVREQQPSDDKLRLIDLVSALAREFDPQAETTGLFVVLTNLIDSLLRDQWVSFVLAGAGIALTMSVAFRNSVWGVLSLLPNVFPILLVIGLMGWIDLPVNMATAMISSVSMGLTVDSSIHFLAGFRNARSRGLSFVAALEETNRDVGRALLIANLALISGFLVLSASHFIPLAYFGILISVAMLGGLLGNLVLLPVLLRCVELITLRLQYRPPESE